MKFNLLILASLDDFTHINYLFGACYRVVWLQHFLHVYLLQCYHKEEPFLLLAHAFLSSFLSSRMSLGSLLYSVDFSYHCLFWCSLSSQIWQVEVSSSWCLSPADKALSSFSTSLLFGNKKRLHTHPKLSQDQPWNWPFLQGAMVPFRAEWCLKNKSGC